MSSLPMREVQRPAHRDGMVQVTFADPSVLAISRVVRTAPTLALCR